MSAKKHSGFLLKSRKFPQVGSDREPIFTEYSQYFFQIIYYVTKKPANFQVQTLVTRSAG
jgi:hypothetical protein